MLACQAGPAVTSPTAALPTGSLAPIAATANTALAGALVDTHFDTFAARLDLAKTFGAKADVIVDQMRRTRADVAAARTSRGTSGAHQASAPGAAASLFSVPLFAQAFAGFLDLATTHPANEDLPGRPLESSSEDPGTRVKTTTSLRTREHISSAGSKVTYSMTWTYRMTTTDTAAGTTLVDGVDERTLVGTIDVCPDASGTAAATLAAHASVGATKLVNGAGVQIKSDSKSDNGFAGAVNDSAKLTSVKRDFHEQASWQTENGSGSYETNMSAVHGTTSDGGLVGGSLSGFTGTFTASGDTGGIDPSKATGWTFAIDMWAMDEPYKAAQELWRNGRCVMVTAPDYGAETPINKGEQTKSQHDESVDQGSQTKLAVNTKHRFAGSLSQPVVAALSGEKKLEPSRVEAMPGQLTYTAPDEQDKKATVTLKSTSKRGIGTLVLDFHTGGALILGVNGTATTHLSFIGTTSDQTIRVTFGPLEFKSVPGAGVLMATGEWQSTFRSVTANSISTQTCEGTEKGTVEAEARPETRSEKKVYVVSLSSADGAGTQTCEDTLGGTTLRGVTLPRVITGESSGGSADVFLAAIGSFEVPASGGSVQIRGSREFGGPGSPAVSAQGTATAKTSK